MIKAVVFDVYGTVVSIGDVRRPYRNLLRFHGTLLNSPSAFQDVMRRTTTLERLAAELNVEIPAAIVAALVDDLAAELASVHAFGDVAPVWTVLRKHSLKIGVCSNLATPYVDPALRSLPFAPDACSWSCNVGYVKDEPEIYKDICGKLGVELGEALMVGDTLKTDVVGPRAVGMKAVHLQRQITRAPTEKGIASLYELLEMLGLPVKTQSMD